MDVAFSGGKVAAIGDDLAEGARDVKDVTGKIVTPGLIDLHTHVYWGGTSLGVDPLVLARGGCTTLVDTGSAGPGNYAGFLEHVIKPSPVRIIAYLNVSFAGIYGFSKRIMVGESGDLRLMAPIDAVEVAEANRDTLAGIKVRVGFHASGNSGLVPLDIARQVAERVDMPMMVHIDHPPPTLPEVLALHASGRRSHPLLPGISQHARDRRRQGASGGSRCARAGRDLRYRPRHGLVLVQHRARHARTTASCRIASPATFMRSASTAPPSTC